MQTTEVSNHFCSARINVISTWQLYDDHGRQIRPEVVT